jgi:hypothetical protein
MADAPISYTNLNENIQQPTSPGMPAIPLASDLPSALEAIRALTQGYNTQYNMNPAGNRNNSTPKKPKLGKYVEDKPKRITKKERIYHKDDKTGKVDKEQYVDVETINSLTFKDTITGELWTWSR